MKNYIYGAGAFGSALYDDAKRAGVFITAYIDDDPEKMGGSVNGVPIISLDSLLQAISPQDCIILCFPSLDRNKIIEKAFNIKKQLNCKIKILPDYYEIISMQIKSGNLALNLYESLIESDSVISHSNEALINKRVVVTGAGGSIGSRVCFELVLQNSSHIIINDQNEFSLFEIEKSLKAFIDASGYEIKLDVVLGDVSNSFVASELMSFNPDIVIHAAAYKHVHMGERSARSVIMNNVLSTFEILKASRETNIPAIILVSTDKAVKPTSIMGFSKLLCEQLMMNEADLLDDSVRSIVRFGNVLGSSGSVIPIFRNGFKSKIPFEVRGRNTTRFFMTIEEAAALICRVANIKTRSSKFVLDMGAPVKIYDLALCVAYLEGIKFDDNGVPDYPIEIVNLLQGEKEHEDLAIGRFKKTDENNILEIVEDAISYYDLDSIECIQEVQNTTWFIELLDKVGLS